MNIAGGRTGLGGAIPTAKADPLADRANSDRLDPVRRRLTQGRAAILEQAHAGEERAGQVVVLLQLLSEQHPAGRHHVLVGRRDRLQVPHRLAEPRGHRLAGVDVERATAMGRVVQDRIGAQAVAPGRGVDQHRRLRVVETGGDLGDVEAHRAMRADHRLGQARGARCQQIFGVLVRSGDGGGAGCAVEVRQCDVARPRRRRRDHGQANQARSAEPFAEQDRILGEDGGGVERGAGMGQAHQVGAWQAVLRRDRRDRHPLAHGGVGDQRVVDVVARQDQQGSFTHHAQGLQARRQRRDPLPGLGEGHSPPTRAGAFRQPDTVRRRPCPMGQ